MRNKYRYRSHISEGKFREIVLLFSEDLMATQIARITGVSRTTINTVLRQIREVIAAHCESISPFHGEMKASLAHGVRKASEEEGLWGKQLSLVSANAMAVSIPKLPPTAQEPRSMRLSRHG
jgi:hypothetical protein